MTLSHNNTEIPKSLSDLVGKMMYHFSDNQICIIVKINTNTKKSMIDEQNLYDFDLFCIDENKLYKNHFSGCTENRIFEALNRAWIFV